MNTHVTDTVAMREAMRDAGINMPTNQRLVWNWIKEHPGQPCRAVQAGVKINAQSVSAQLSQMVERGMLSAVLERSMPLNRNIFHYSVVGKEFKLMPSTSRERGIKKLNRTSKNVIVPMQEVAAAPVIVAPLTHKEEAEAILSRSSILLAKELFNQLTEIFRK